MTDYIYLKFPKQQRDSLREKYLASIKSSKNTDYLSQLKCKIIDIFDQNLAYQLVSKGHFEGVDDSSNFTISCRKPVKITKHQQLILLEEIRSVYGNHVKSLKITLATPKESIPDLPWEEQVEEY